MEIFISIFLDQQVHTGKNMYRGKFQYPTVIFILKNTTCLMVRFNTLRQHLVFTTFKWTYLLVFLLYQRFPTNKNMYRGELRLSRINPKLAKNQLDSDW